METAVLGGGCFWCLEAVFRRMRGVLSVVSGYAGGASSNPTYEAVCGGLSGHIEVVKVEFDAASISFARLLEVFFAIHDPTSWDRQGNDCGSQYRSVIFCQSAEQRQTAEKMIETLEGAGIWERPIVTEVRDDAPFFAAESYHQRYFELHPDQAYCHYVVAPKVAKLRSKFSDLLAADEG